MAHTDPITFVALQVLSAAQLNGIQNNIRAAWPYTTAGDTAYATSATAIARRAIGAAGQINTVVAGVPAWATNPAIASAAAAQATADNAHSDAATAQGQANIGVRAGINVILGDGVSLLPTGVLGYLEAAYAFTIESVTLLADASGSCVIDIWKAAYASYPPTNANTITSATPPTLAAAVKSQNTTLTGWTTTVAKGDILAFNVDSAVTVEQVTLSIKGRKTAVS